MSYGIKYSKFLDLLENNAINAAMEYKNKFIPNKIYSNVKYNELQEGVKLGCLSEKYKEIFCGEINFNNK